MAPAVLIPVKSFDLAKGRLAQTLSPAERSRLAITMAQRVIAAARPLPTWVVCDDPEVASFAVDNGAGVVWRRSRGLNAAVHDGITHLREEGHDQVIVAHADLPLAQTLAWVADFDGVSIVADRRGDGTNVLVVPTAIEFAFRYGPGSAVAHQAEALRHGCAYRILDDPDLGWDVDLPEDLSVLERPSIHPSPAQEDPRR